MALVEDLGVFFADHGVVATFAGATASVIFDRPDEEILGRRVQSTGYLMTYPRTVFAALARGSVVSIGGVSYTVQTIRTIDDGEILQAELERAP